MANKTERRSQRHRAITKNDIPRMMTRAEVAEALGVSPGTLRNWNSQGKGPMPAPYSERKALYFPEDVMDFRDEEHKKLFARPPR